MCNIGSVAEEVQTRRVSIGKHGSPWTPEAARKEAKRLLGEVAAGRDPAEEKAKARDDMTVGELCDLYLAEGCATKKPSTLFVDRGRIERHIKPLLGRKRAPSVTRSDVERLLRDVATGKTARVEKTRPRGRANVRGGKGTANRTVSLLSAIFTFAVSRGIRSDNPALRIKRYPGTRRERFLTPSEFAALGDALEKEVESPVAIAAIRLLTLTGCRKSEILGLRWSEIDWGRNCLRLPDSKTGAKIIPLGTAAIEQLRTLPRLEGVEYVFPSNRSGGHFVGLQKVWSQARRRAGLEGVRLHDLRHSFASVAVSGGDSLYLLGKVLGHRQSRTIEIYAHLAEDPVRAVAERTSSEIASALNGISGDKAKL